MGGPARPAKKPADPATRRDGVRAIRRPDLYAGPMITNGVGYDSWPIPSVKAMRATAPLLARLPAAALKPALGVLLARGHDDRARARSPWGVHLPSVLRTRRRGGDGPAGQRARRPGHAGRPGPAADAAPSRPGRGVADQFQKIDYGERFAREFGTTVPRKRGASPPSTPVPVPGWSGSAAARGLHHRDHACPGQDQPSFRT